MWARCSDDAGGFPNITGLKSICFRKTRVYWKEISFIRELAPMERDHHICLPHPFQIASWGTQVHSRLIWRDRRVSEIRT